MTTTTMTTSISTRGLTTLDLLKSLAVALMIADHVGLYLLDNEPWLRIMGRGAAVMFGFLIGFSGSARVPPSWIMIGLSLSLVQQTLFPYDEQNALDILISLALTRVVMPYFERLHAAGPLVLLPIVVVLALAAEPLNVHLEYATEVTIAALLGLAVRLDRGEARQRAARDGIALTALVTLSLIALRHFEFEGWHLAGCVAVLTATIVGLAHFRRVSISLPGWLEPIIAFCGRNTLWIYAVHLVLFQLIAWADTDAPPPSPSTDDDSE